MTRLGVHRRELVEACLAVTGQRVDAACALASAYVSGNLETLSDDELIAAFKLVFRTNVKPKHLRELERLLPCDSRPPQTKRRRVDLTTLCREVYDQIVASLDGLGCVFCLETHASVRDLLDYVYERWADDPREPTKTAAFLALADELLTPPVKKKLASELEPMRRRVQAAWALCARLNYSDLAEVEDEHCAGVARRAEKSRFHGAQRLDIAQWLRQRGHWLPKAASVDASPHPKPHFAQKNLSHSRLPTLLEEFES